MSPFAVRSLRAITLLLIVAATGGGAERLAAQPDPKQALAELLAADRAFSASGAAGSVVAAIGAMISADAVMPLPNREFARGRDSILSALRGNSDNLQGRFEWTPIRGGVSADGTHGFTFGYGTVSGTSRGAVAVKYLAYWIKGAEGWRVAAYKRAPRPEGAVSLAEMAPALPDRGAASADRGTHRKWVAELKAREQAFSDEAGKTGLGPAFFQFGSADAVNMGGPASPGFVVGNEAISKSVGGGGPAQPSPIVWGADEALVAGSGDLGVTIGRIRRKEDPPGTGAPFFTIWRRATPRDRWLYVAE